MCTSSYALEPRAAHLQMGCMALNQSPSTNGGIICSSCVSSKLGRHCTNEGTTEQKRHGFRSKDALESARKSASENTPPAVWDVQLGGGMTGLRFATGHACRVAWNVESLLWDKLFEEGELIKAVDALALLVQQGSPVRCSLFYRILRRCIAEKDLGLGRRVHALSLIVGCETDSFLANHFIRMYASHGRLQEAMEVFAKVNAADTFMWNSIISAHSDHGHPAQSINLYRQMSKSTVKACACGSPQSVCHCRGLGIRQGDPR